MLSKPRNGGKEREDDDLEKGLYFISIFRGENPVVETQSSPPPPTHLLLTLQLAIALHLC